MVPFAIEVLAAEIVIDCSVAAVTVSAKVFEVTPLWVAVMLTEPMPAPVANPAALIVATAVLDEFHVAELVRFCVVPSVNVPVAVNWSVVPFAMELLGALMLIDCSVAAVTVKAKVLEVTPLCVAVMFVAPAPVPVTRPLALIVATAVLDEFQVAELVRS